MRYAVATSRTERDPCVDLRGALTPSRQKQMAAITAILNRSAVYSCNENFQPWSKKLMDFFDLSKKRDKLWAWRRDIYISRLSVT